jgi:hypothetical protein
VKWLALAALLIGSSFVPASAVPREPPVPPICARQPGVCITTGNLGSRALLPWPAPPPPP